MKLKRDLSSFFQQLLKWALELCTPWEKNTSHNNNTYEKHHHCFFLCDFSFLCIWRMHTLGYKITIGTYLKNRQLCHQKKKWFQTTIPCIVPVLPGWAESTNSGMFYLAFYHACWDFWCTVSTHHYEAPVCWIRNAFIHSHAHQWAKQSRHVLPIKVLIILALNVSSGTWARSLILQHTTFAHCMGWWCKLRNPTNEVASCGCVKMKETFSGYFLILLY